MQLKIRAVIIVGAGITSCVALSGAVAPLPSLSASIAISRLASEPEMRSLPSLSKRANRAQRDECVSYGGARLYTDNLQGDGDQLIQAFIRSARGTPTPICSLTASLSPQIGGMIVDHNGTLWVVDAGRSTLNAFPQGTEGASVPSQVISGKRTRFAGNGAIVQHLAVDSTNNIWVPQFYGGGGYVVAFANSANGNVAPIATIGYGDKGSSEGIRQPTAVTFDRSGNLYVLDFSYNVLVFTPPFSDTERPVQTWNTGEDIQQFMTSDGRNIYTASEFICHVFDDGIKTHGTISRSFFTSTGKHGGGYAYDLKADGDGHLYFPDTAPIKNGPIHSVIILPPGATSTKKRQVLNSPQSQDAMDNIALTPSY